MVGGAILEHLGGMHSPAGIAALLIAVIPFTALLAVVAREKRLEARDRDRELDRRDG